jgi:flavin reductase (DIM6/NTAB) family NADH-FMN oxidoreductase RutF
MAAGGASRCLAGAGRGQNGGVTIHPTDPFATPEDARTPLRRARGRLPATVTLWTAYGPDGRPAGLTVSSTLVADGDPGAVFGLLDDESDLYAALLASGRFVVTALADGDGQLADRFAGLLPAPGGLFSGGDWEQTGYGPVPARRHPWVACVLESSRQAGYAMLVAGSVQRVELGTQDVPPLVHYRGRYVRLPGGQG